VEVEARPIVEATLEPEQQGGGGLSLVAAFIGESLEKAINVAEEITGIDLDMDGDVGLVGQPGLPPPRERGVSDSEDAFYA